MLPVENCTCAAIEDERQDSKRVFDLAHRLIGEWVESRLHADHVEIWYADKLAYTLARLVGRDKHAVHYRNVIDSLVREPGAFANYAYRDDLFPTTRFRLPMTASANGSTNAARPRNTWRCCTTRLTPTLEDVQLVVATEQ